MAGGEKERTHGLYQKKEYVDARAKGTIIPSNARDSDSDHRGKKKGRKGFVRGRGQLSEPALTARKEEGGRA